MNLARHPAAEVLVDCPYAAALPFAVVRRYGRRHRCQLPCLCLCPCPCPCQLQPAAQSAPSASPSLAIYQMSTRMLPVSRMCCSAPWHSCLAHSTLATLWPLLLQLLLTTLSLLLLPVRVLVLLLSFLLDIHLLPGQPHQSASFAPANRHFHCPGRAMWRADRTGLRCQVVAVPRPAPQQHIVPAAVAHRRAEVQTVVLITCQDDVQAWAWPWHRSTAVAPS